MAGEGRVGVVEPDHEPDAQLVLAHRVDEAAAELVPLRGLAQRPAHRVDHPVERLLDLPDLLHAELPARRQRAVEVEVVERRLGQVAERALGEHRRLRDHVGAGLEVAQRLAVLAAPAVAGADAADDPVLHQQLVGDRLGEDVGALLLRLLGQEARQLRDRDHVVAVVAEVRRHRLQRQRRPLGQQVDRVLGHLLVGERPVGGVEVREQLPHRRRLHVRAAQRVRAADLALLDHRHRHLAELLHQLGLVGEQVEEPVRAGEPGRARRRRSRRRPRSARPRDRSARRSGRARRRAAGTHPARRPAPAGVIARLSRPSWPSRPRSAWA